MAAAPRSFRSLSSVRASTTSRTTTGETHDHDVSGVRQAGRSSPSFSLLFSLSRKPFLSMILFSPFFFFLSLDPSYSHILAILHSVSSPFSVLMFVSLSLSFFPPLPPSLPLSLTLLSRSLLRNSHTLSSWAQGLILLICHVCHGAAHACHRPCCQGK